MPDRDFYACAEDEIAGTSSLLTMVGGKFVYGAGEFAALDDGAPPPAMPDWSPVRRYGGYAGWGDAASPNMRHDASMMRQAAASCGCAQQCGIHGHAHATAWTSKLPIADLKSFWGALGCACWAV